mmetsp:Transcript_12107/g.20505  ORF Transcript_12107/g.20505 Transcript_12107/m.20505 type:complete len:413 (+) Transcript_12107:158-1396(+)
MNSMLWLLYYSTLIAQALASSQRDLIINGTIAPQQRYPYAVFLQDNDFPFCGGSLIAADVVLTAAHCIPEDDYIGNITVMEGEHNLTDTELGDVVRIRENVIHPLYQEENEKDFDIALTFLERPTAIERDSLVHLNRDNSYPPDDTVATYLGWGVVNSKGEASNILREVDVSVMTNEECNRINGTVFDKFFFSMSGHITPSMMCTFAEGKDSCQRDSGGPLIVRKKNIIIGEDNDELLIDASRDIQIGVSSWGVNCADPVFPGVVSRVSSSWDFIRDNVCSKSSMPPDYFECFTMDKPTFQPQSLAPSSKPTLLNTTKVTSVDQTPSVSLNSTIGEPTLQPQSIAPSSKPSSLNATKLTSVEETPSLNTTKLTSAEQTPSASLNPASNAQTLMTIMNALLSMGLGIFYIVNP